MRHFGTSLIGFERLVSRGLFAAEVGRLPKPRERLSFTVTVTPPRRGSFEFVALLDPGAAFLPLVHDLYRTAASDIMWNWMSGALKKMAGRGEEADSHINEMLKTMDSMHARTVEADDRRDQRRHSEILAAIESQRFLSAGKEVVSPIGPASERLILQRNDNLTEIDFAAAEVIRSGGKIKVGDMESIRLKIDGYVHHNKQLKVVHPQFPGRFVTAYVRDPVFDQAPNIYTDAAAIQGWLQVNAKVAMRKSGDIHAIYVMDARPIDEPSE
ncbi:MAG: hypothetical protein OXI73_07820 [Rhodospirillales bacterium]|nr:hypothetical protein [Rhodospirillales bacterium]